MNPLHEAAKWVLITIVLLMVLLGVAFGHTVNGIDYSQWKNLSGMNCCNNIDCYPTQARYERGQWYGKRREDGVWLRIPPHAYDGRAGDSGVGAPGDGMAHMCAPKPGGGGTLVYCFTPGFGG
jgi:hypothetical protein